MSAAEIRNIIAYPDKYLTAQSRPVTVVTCDGRSFTGMIRSNDNFSIAIQTTDGSFHFFKRFNVKQIKYSSHSLMPDNYTSTFDKKSMNDLVSYLMDVGEKIATHPPK